jgi:hypothetical protein
MKTAPLPLIALVACLGTSCTKQEFVDVAELEDHLARVEQSHKKLGQEIARSQQLIVRLETEYRGLVDERVVTEKKLDAMAADALRLREEFVSYRTKFLSAARTRSKGLKIPQIEVGGKVFTNVLVRDTANDVLSFTHSEGSSQIDMADLDEEVQMLVGYDAENPRGEEVAVSQEQLLSLAIAAGEKAREDVYTSLERKPAPPKPKPPVQRSQPTNRPAWMSRSSFEGPSIAPYGGPRRTVSRSN